MKKMISCCLLGSMVAFAGVAIAQDDDTMMMEKKETSTTMMKTTSTSNMANMPMKGRLFEIMSKNPKMTDEWCKMHAPDTYMTNNKMVDKEIKGDNGVMAKNIKHTMTEMGGVYMLKGTATFTGMENDKEWMKMVHYMGFMVMKDGAERGAWYTDDCKGFYEVLPA